MPGKTINIKEFAGRVERMCDFFLAKVEEGGSDGSDDLRVVQDLKEDAANIQFGGTGAASETLEGLHDYMNGV